MPTIDTALIVLAGIALFAAFVNGAIGYGFSSLTVPVALLFYTNRILNPAIVVIEVFINFYVLFINRNGVPAVLKRRSEEHTSELQSRLHLVCRLLLEKKKNNYNLIIMPFPMNKLLFTYHLIHSIATSTVLTATLPHHSRTTHTTLIINVTGTQSPTPH